MFIIYDKLEKIGQRIQKARKQKNLTQIQFAELLNISTSHLSDIETGRTNFGIDILMNITELLQVSADYLLRTDIPEVAAIHSREIDAILKAVIKNGKALEINTSGYRQKIGRTMPDVDIIKRYKELGGELITLGSDSHFAEHVGAGIERGMQLALDCGFTSIALFQQREPVLIPIE